MDSIEELLYKNGIALEVTDIASDGFYIPKLRTMFVNQELDPENQKAVILHELKHALDHSELWVLYKLPVFHQKMEAEADSYMINHLIAENGGQYNYSGLFEEYNLGLGWECNLKRAK